VLNHFVIPFLLHRLVALIPPSPSRQETRILATGARSNYIINHYEKFAQQLNRMGFEAVVYVLCLNSTKDYWTNMAEVIAPQEQFVPL